MKHDKIVLLAKTKLNSIDQKNTFFFFLYLHNEITLQKFTSV